LILDFLKFIESVGSPGASLDVRGYMLAKFATETGGFVVATEDRVRDWLDVERAVKPSTRDGQLSGLRRFYRWAICSGRLEHPDPTYCIDNLRGDSLPGDKISDEDLKLALLKQSLLNAEHPQVMRCWLYLGAFAGCSAMEIAGIRRDDVLDLATPAYLRIRQGKRGGERLVPLNDLLPSAIHDLKVHEDGELWTWDEADLRIAGSESQVVSRKVAQYLRDVLKGVSDGRPTENSLRHWFGHQVFQLTGDLVQTQALLGLRTPTAATIYRKSDGSDVSDDIRHLRVG
jgi:site-specific recombinase XerD